LDLKHNRYHGLGVQSAPELAALATNWAQISTSTHPMPAAARHSALHHAPAFIDAGLLSRLRPEITFSASHVDLHSALTSIGLQEQRTVSVRSHHILNFVRACWWAKKSLRSPTLYSIACELSIAKTRASAPAELRHTIDLTCIFRRLRPYAFESKDRCLFHALALLHFLGRYGSHPTWVIGVCAKPWSAHSWLQLDNWLLDCSFEQVCAFVPILAI